MKKLLVKLLNSWTSMATALRAYARALYEAVEGKKKPEVKTLVTNFLQVLKEKNQLSKINEIISEIEKIDDMENHRIQAEIISATRLDEAVMKKIEKILQKRTGAKEIVWEKKIDKQILGGVILKFQDSILDLSLATRINALAAEIKK